MLHGAGAAIFMVPAKRVHDARELYDNVPSKHDPKDAVTLARLRSQGTASGSRSTRSAETCAP